MANSRIGQYQLEYMIEGFTSPSRAHALRFYVRPTAPVSVGTPLGDVDFQALGGGSVDAVIGANNLWEFIRPMYNNSISSSFVTLWRYATNTSRDFISAAPLTNPLCSGSAGQAMQQATLTFRTALGSLLKIVILENNLSGNASVPLIAAPAGNVHQRLAAHIMSVSGIVTGIDNSFPVTPLRDSRGQNEKLFRVINR
jgi:hypothetical protein